MRGRVDFGRFVWFAFYDRVSMSLPIDHVLVKDSPSCLLRPALACRRLAASIRALSRSTSFSRCSYCLAVIAASARAFLERLPPSLSSSESSSIAASLERDRPVSDIRRARLASCLTL